MDAADALRLEVARHKRAIAQHRNALHAAKAALSQIECARDGIKITRIGEGEAIHGRQATCTQSR